jgi:hypothetical protein
MDQNKSIEADVSVPTLQEASKIAASAGKDNTNAEGASTRAMFKKIKGSNPREVRRQFLQHTMGASGSGYNVADYIVGCIDRKAGILEKKVENWKSFDEEELIAYFKDVKSNEIVWDRARKIDLVFGKDES